MRTLATALLLALAPLGAARAQSPSPDSLLASCAREAEAKREAPARAAADLAESLFRQQLRARPDDPAPRVGLARLISQCRIPFANLMSAGRLIGDSNRLLEEALEKDPRDWEARFVLGMNHLHTPEFLGRGDDAVRAFEALIAQQGERADRPGFALPYVYLGDLYQRGGRRAEALAIWQRGARLFPDHPLLKQRLERARPAAAPADPAPVRVEALTVRVRRLNPQSTLGGVALNRFEVITSPGGAGDLLQGVKMQGGVTQAGDGSDLMVRGGEAAEVPVFLDGGRMVYAGSFETLHGGLFGVLNPQVIREVRFSSGGFSARYGNALSGVLDVETEGRPTRARASAGVSLAGGSGSAWTPLGSRAGAWATGRLTDAGLLVRMQGLGESYTASPRSGEATAGLTFLPRPGVEAKATALVQRDGATRVVESNGHTGPFRSRGRTLQGVLSLRAARSDGAQVRASLTAAERGSGFRFGVLDRERTDRTVGGRAALDLPVGAATLRGGVEAAWLGAREEGATPRTASVAPGTPTRVVDERADARHLGGFAELELDPAPGLSVVAGVRADRLPGETEWTADPRLALAYRLPGWTVRLGGGVFRQGRWRIGYSLPDAGTPAGLPRRARHLALGVESQGEGTVKVEAFLKEYDRYVPLGEGPAVTAGHVAGVDTRVRYALGERLSGWVAYSFLRGRVELEDGSTVPSRIDVTHGLTAVGKWALGEAWELGTTARYATGRPYSPVEGATPPAAGADGVWEPTYASIHGARLPDYRRLDVRLTRIGAVRGRRTLGYLELLNALNHRNVMGYTYDAAYRERRSLESFFARRIAVLGLEVQLP